MLSKSFNLKLNHKISSFNKIIKVDPDKSISIRSFLLGSISQNISYIKNALESDDVFSTINCLRKLGVKIKRIKSKNYLIYGKGLGSLRAKKNTILNFGNSGTLARLLIGILSTTPNIQVTVKGDRSLNKRNMKKLINLMTEYGATFLPTNKVNFPLKIISTDMPVGISYKSGVSAQLKSAVILAGLNSYGLTKIIDKGKSRDHTENMLLKNHKSINIRNKKDKVINVYGKRALESFNIDVPGDPSSAAFFTALTILNENSSLKIKGVGLNPTRIGFYNLLKKQGAKIKFLKIKGKNNEIRGDVLVKSSKLKPLKTDKAIYPSTADEFPILFVIAAFTQGISVFRGIGDLANKESNRILEMQKILKQIGIRSISKKDEIKIFGKNSINASEKKIVIPNLGDHRICMSSFILSILSGCKTKIKNFETVNTSSPSFLKTMKFLGVKFEKQK